MRHKYDIHHLLSTAIGYKAATYPGMLAASKTPNLSLDYRITSSAPPFGETTSTGTPLYSKAANGTWYFMPVTLGDVELQSALISVKGQKTIISTPLVGANGTVKELISTNDYTISIVGAIYSDFQTYPEKEIVAVRELYQKSESLRLMSAITDLLLQSNDHVVIKSIDFPAPSNGIEHVQVVKIECVTDIAFNLDLENV